MEKKNTVLLTVIAVATLLVAVVGATFAYFTATANTDNTGAGSTNVQTRNDVGGVELKLAANTVSTDGDIQYPGGYVVTGATVTAKSLGTDNYNVNYTLNGTITNGTDTELKYKVYQTTTQVTGKMVDECTMRQYQATVDGKTELRYTYMNADNSATTCTVNTGITTGSTVLVADGTVAAATTTGEGEAAVTTAGKATITLSSTANTSMALTSTSAGASTYYYVVVEYPDTGAAQAATGASIVATLSSVSDAVSTQAS